MVNRYTLGSIVLGIFLLAILGVSRAMSWLGQSTAETTPDDRIVAIESDSPESAGSAARLSQADGQFDNQTISQADSIERQADSIDRTKSDANLARLPLEEAGTFIQRQKRVEEDKIVTNTRVDVIPVANNNVAAQSDTITPQEPAAASDTRPATQTTNTPPAVPALW